MNDKVLIIDIETAPIVSFTWGTRDQNIANNQIQRDWSIIAFAAKWLGDPPSKVVYYDLRGFKDITADSELLKKVWVLLNEADIVITQNGKNFDGPKLNARFIMHGMKPPREYKHLDTYQIVSKVAKFTSNKLEYLTDKLCTKYKKLTHKKFPGFDLWRECMKDNKAAWNEMKKYNIHDVLATEELYERIKDWAPKSMPKPHLCKKPVYRSEGTRRTSAGLYRRNYCLKCGELFKERIQWI